MWSSTTYALKSIAGEALDRNKRGGFMSGTSYARKNIHLFGGLMYCESCGRIMSATVGDIRADGYRPSTYGCQGKRKNLAICRDSRFINDAKVCPLVFNYIANIMKLAKRGCGKLSYEGIEKRLLKGAALSEVSHIEGIEELEDAIENNGNKVLFQPPVRESPDSDKALDILLELKRKDETALSRLQNLFMFGDIETPEKDFLIERARITKELEETNSKIAELEKKSAGKFRDEDFIYDASYFIVMNKLLETGEVDYVKLSRILDKKLLRDFFLATIKRIYIDKGRVKSITFRNGMTHRFIYD